jgi:N-acetylmuramoyl-L-alanine amidase
MEIKNHKLTGTGTSFEASPNQGGPFGAGLPDTVVIHFTAGASLESSVKSLCNPASKASAHVVVGRDGAIVQLVPLNIVSWHAGASTFGNRTGLNKFSIGIEIDNAGRLTQTASGDFVTWFGRRVQPQDAIQGIHRNETTPSWWHTFTETQIERVFELVDLLVQTYAITAVLGHEEIAPGRKTDPGPAFPLDRLRDRLLGAGRQEDAPAVPTVGVGAAPISSAGGMASFGTPVSIGTGKPRSGGRGKPRSGGKRKPKSGGSGKPRR